MSEKQQVAVVRKVAERAQFCVNLCLDVYSGNVTRDEFATMLEATIEQLQELHDTQTSEFDGAGYFSHT